MTLHKDEILKILKTICKLNIYVSISLDDHKIDLEYFTYFFEYILSQSNLSFDVQENLIERDRILNSINKYIEKLSTCYLLVRYHLNDLETVIILEDSVVLYFGVCYRYYNHSQLERSYVSSIQELTYNFLTKVNVFQKRKEYALTYYRFIGAEENNNKFKYFDETMQFERVNNILPELKLKERYDAWQGTLYHFVVFEL